MHYDRNHCLLHFGTAEIVQYRRLVGTRAIEALIKYKSVYKLLHNGSRVFIRLLTSVNVIDSVRFNREGAYILAANHLHFLDGPMMFAQTPGNKTFIPLAADKWRNNLISRWFLDGIGAVYVNRDEIDRTALKALLGHLKAGRCIGVSPEGTRSKTGALMQAKSGICWLARTANVPIIPMAHWGIEQFRLGYRPKVELRLGDPFWVTREDNLDARTADLMKIIAAMLPVQYRGVYE